MSKIDNPDTARVDSVNTVAASRKHKKLRERFK